MCFIDLVSGIADIHIDNACNRVTVGWIGHIESLCWIAARKNMNLLYNMVKYQNLAP